MKYSASVMFSLLDTFAFNSVNFDSTLDLPNTLFNFSMDNISEVSVFWNTQPELTFTNLHFNINSYVFTDLTGQNSFDIYLHDPLAFKYSQLTPEQKKSKFIAWSDDLVFTDYLEYSAHCLDAELERLHKLRPDLSKEKICHLLEGTGSDSIEFALWLIDNEDKVDESNIFHYKGHDIDVTKLSKSQIFSYLTIIEDQNSLLNLAHVKTLLQASTPTQKLYYPAPFHAAPTFMHDDIFFIHILQYQFWLWFVFIFLIVFFFISFICTARWCALRSQPRRETRGVSRSKCGDLITAIVPVTWAISIIVGESTDASDTYDGFSTKEVMIGIRAYQWGWEYYYPKAVNLQYNLKPSYSAFIGNSLKYTTSSDLTLDSNNVWKQYQNKATDRVITPAHLLVLPIDNHKLFHFMNFNDIGARTAVNSVAFAKIRSASKVFNTNLVHTPSVFLNKYQQISKLLETENKFTDAGVYGLRRQHNLTANAALNAHNVNFLNKTSFEDFLNHTTHLELNQRLTETFTQDGRYIQDVAATTTPQVGSTQPSLFVGGGSLNTENSFNLTQLDNFSCEEYSKHNNTLTHLSVDSDLTRYNSSTLLTHTESASNDEGVLGGEQSVYHMVERDSRTMHLNTHGTSQVDYSNLSGIGSVGTPLSGYSSNDLDSRLSVNNSLYFTSNRNGYDEVVLPILSNNPQLTQYNYNNSHLTASQVQSFNGKLEKTTVTDTSDVVHILQGRREGALSSLNSSYWQAFWVNSHPDLRINSLLQAATNTDSSQLPLFVNYYEYDFRNAQALELLEESYWETSYSSYNHLDYLNINESYTKRPFIDPSVTNLDVLYCNENTNEVEGLEDLLNPAMKDLSLVGQFYTNLVQSDDTFTSSNLTLMKDFSNFPLVEIGGAIDDTYLNTKEHNLFLNTSNSLGLASNSDTIVPQSYIGVLNSFRSDFDDFTISTEYPVLDNDLDDVPSDLSNESLLVNNTHRFSNPITLRKTAKNSIVTYSAVQKVFKTRFEEGRANIKLSHFSDLKSKQAFTNEARIPYEKLLGKNCVNFFNNTFYNPTPFKSFNNFTTLNNILNTWFFDFPFLVGMMSDGSRHFWFDWYAQWALCEVQPSSLAKFSTLGVPYMKKNHDFNLNDGDSIQASDRYLTRISRSRKNYLPNWLYTPYLYTRSQVWNKTSLADILLPQDVAQSNHTLTILRHMHWYWQDHFFTSQVCDTFTPSISGNNIYNQAGWRPQEAIQSYYYHNSLLVDLLTKREFIYRQYFENKHRIIALPKVLTANPQHPLVRELKASFLFIDPTTYNSEYSREVYYNSLDYFKFMILKEWLLQLDQRLNALPINTNLVNNYLFYYFFTPYKSSSVGANVDLYKSQFRPLKKGITSMLRLQGTGAVAMPIEIRLQILASSKDVIHSWAVPSAGVKIDCIPGYTSHRIMTFLTPGIYWGQCQEICGRYHHWMPIVVYFMKRDLFFLWCTHFVFRSPANVAKVGSDRQLSDYVKFASYDKNSWLNEVSNF